MRVENKNWKISPVVRLQHRAPPVKRQEHVWRVERSWEGLLRRLRQRLLAARSRSGMCVGVGVGFLAVSFPLEHESEKQEADAGPRWGLLVVLRFHLV